MLLIFIRNIFIELDDTQVPNAHPLEDHIEYNESEFIKEGIEMGSVGCDSKIHGNSSEKYEQNLR